MNQPRTYGGWRPRRGFAIGRLSEAQSATVLVCVLLPLIGWVLVASFGLPAVALAVITALSIATAALSAIPHPRRGTSIGGALITAMRLAAARRKGWLDWESGVFTTHPRRRELPGALAPLMPLSTQDALGQPYGLLWDRRTGRLSAGIRLAPVGTVLADPDRTDLWVGSYAAWQAALGHEPMIEWVAITVDTAPSAGTELAEYVRSRIDPAAPPLARRVLTEVADAHRGATADITVRATVTLQPQRARPQPQDDAERVAAVTRALAGVENGLPMCGVAVLGRATAGQWTRWLRGAFDPASRAELARLDEQDHLLDWADAGPITTTVGPDHYQHDTGWSVSWAMSELPHQQVTSTVLAPLLTPGRFHRRVSIVYQPVPADTAAELVTREATGSSFRRELRRRRKLDTTARDLADEARAKQAAEEEASGAGVGLQTLYVTTTVTRPAELADAVADVESRARAARLRLRPCADWQPAGFAAALGVGVYPPELARRGRWSR